MSYCIAFSKDGATDVTRRYVRKSECLLPRTRVSESVLYWIILEIRKIHRESLDKTERMELLREDEREEKELARYAAHGNVADLLRSLSLETSRQESGGSYNDRKHREPDYEHEGVSHATKKGQEVEEERIARQRSSGSTDH